jgi:hypothetical protein
MTAFWRIARRFALWRATRAWHVHTRWDNLERYASQRIRRARRK